MIRAAAIGLLAILVAAPGWAFADRSRRGEAPRRSPWGLSKQSARKAPLRAPAPQEREGEGEADGRQSWFLAQRAYPSGTIPADGRRRAWEARGPQTAEKEAAWVPIGPSPSDSHAIYGPSSGRINAVAVSPADSRLLLVGSASGGIWRSTDGGESFLPVADDQVDVTVGSIAFAPTDASIVYAGMGDRDGLNLGTGVLKSIDAGRHWSRVSNTTLPAPGATSKIVVDPLDPNRLYVAQWARQDGAEVRASGIFRSTNGGVSWTRTLAGLASDLAVDPADPRTLYLAMARVDEQQLLPGIYKSSDAGLTWRRVYTLPYAAERVQNVKVAVSPVDSRRVVVLAAGYTDLSSDLRVEVSDDGGATWKTTRGNRDLNSVQAWYNCYLVADPIDANVVYAGTIFPYRSDDAGESWHCVPCLNGNTPHWDQHSFAIAPGDPSVRYIGNDGGLFKSTDGGTTFASINSTLSLVQFVGLAGHPTDPTRLYGGTQDNGTQRLADSTGLWSVMVGGDGGRCVVDALDPSLFYSTYIYGEIYRWSEGGAVFDGEIGTTNLFGESDDRPRIAFYPPFVGNGADATLYFGTWRLFVSTDRGATWTAPAGTLDLTAGTDDVLTAIGVSRSDPRVIYTGSAEGRVMVSSNGGASWSIASKGLPDRWVTSIVVSGSDPSTAWATFSGYASGHIFKTTDRGATWRDVGTNLPDVPVNALLVDPLDSKALLAGTDVGVFRGDAKGRWTAFNAGMPPVIVTAFAAQPGGLVRAATYGRGVYELRRAGVPSASLVRVIAPNGGEKLLAGTNATISWESSSAVPLASQRILLSTDGGRTYPTVLADGLDASARSFVFAIPATHPKTKTARVRVVAVDSAGAETQDDSDRDFKIKSH